MTTQNPNNIVPESSPATISGVIYQGILHGIINWKSTLDGLLTLAVIAGAYFSMQPSGIIFSQHTLQIITIYTGFAKILMAWSKKDAN